MKYRGYFRSIIAAGVLVGAGTVLLAARYPIAAIACALVAMILCLIAVLFLLQKESQR